MDDPNMPLGARKAVVHAFLTIVVAYPVLWVSRWLQNGRFIPMMTGMIVGTVVGAVALAVWSNPGKAIFAYFSLALFAETIAGRIITAIFGALTGALLGATCAARLFAKPPQPVDQELESMEEIRFFVAGIVAGAICGCLTGLGFLTVPCGLFGGIISGLAWRWKLIDGVMATILLWASLLFSAALAISLLFDKRHYEILGDAALAGASFGLLLGCLAKFFCLPGTPPSGSAPDAQPGVIAPGQTVTPLGLGSDGKDGVILRDLQGDIILW